MAAYSTAEEVMAISTNKPSKDQIDFLQKHGIEPPIDALACESMIKYLQRGHGDKTFKSRIIHLQTIIRRWHGKTVFVRSGTSTQSIYSVGVVEYILLPWHYPSKITQDMDEYTLVVRMIDSKRLERLMPHKCMCLEGTDQERQVSRSLDAIKGRVSTNVRFLKAGHVVLLADSIVNLGLLEPIVIDQENRLLAGAHRVAACRLLFAESDKRIKILLEQCKITTISPKLRDALQALPPSTEIKLNPLAIPVRVLAFNSEDDPKLSLFVEVAENEKRRNYTKKEVFALFERLLELGYHDGLGRPPKGKQPVKRVLAAIIGRTPRQVRNILNNSENPFKVHRLIKSSEPKVSLRPSTADEVQLLFSHCMGYVSDFKDQLDMAKLLEEFSHAFRRDLNETEQEDVS